MNYWYFLSLLFIGLKLHGSIDWSWWWVISPLAPAIFLAVIQGVVIGLSAALKK